MTEKQIKNEIARTGLSRLEVIARAELGEQSEAAKRCIAKRKRRKELVEGCGVSFGTACYVVNHEFNQL